MHCFRVLAALPVFVVFFFLFPDFGHAEDALQHYIEKPDSTYAWSIREKRDYNSITIYEIYLRSQTWRDIEWTHQLRILVPRRLQNTKYALLFLTGGSIKDNEPRWKTGMDQEIRLIGDIANKTGSLVVIMRQVPNQPLFGDKKEDEIISYTFQQYFETQDKTWPLLFPMVKSAVRAMDAIQEFSEKQLRQTVNHFVIAGASKRGWTTWLTGASDPRVTAIAPMVIDMLNMKPQMDYQLQVWDQYSEQIGDYTELDLQKKLDEPEGKILAEMVDPYAYREKLTMPKFIFIGTNDRYWPVDAIKFYFDDLKGEKYIHYVPNAGHNLGAGLQAAKSLAGFFGACVAGLPHPSLDWSVANENRKIILRIKPEDTVKHVKLWQSRSNDRDFREERWYSTKQITKDSSQYAIPVLVPKNGYKAFYAQVIFPSPIGGTYSQCTRVYVIDANGEVK
ncbi:MAG: PhoPQ-activated pathogenicity-like protein PqaA type [Candidatus Omnitrophota bacterium]|jgi:PhoPQ-activated pathogenicity-related protein|nr:MAG: PhoPQ-activated pathogenicity-like protein PqaA type [Candidatus Omnitrophota bacterium]